MLQMLSIIACVWRRRQAIRARHYEGEKLVFFRGMLSQINQLSCKQAIFRCLVLSFVLDLVRDIICSRGFSVDKLTDPGTINRNAIANSLRLIKFIFIIFLWVLVPLFNIFSIQKHDSTLFKFFFSKRRLLPTRC